MEGLIFVAHCDNALNSMKSIVVGVIVMSACAVAFAGEVRVKRANIGPKRGKIKHDLGSRNDDQVDERQKSAVKGTLQVIFDSSNSMNGRINGVKKIDLAKKALHHLCATLEDSSFEVGLRVFGNDQRIPLNDRERADKDSKLVIPIRSKNAASIREYIPSLVAHGRTPIGYSILQAGRDLQKYKEKNPMILLISDGVESCGGDPLEAIKAVHASGIKVKAHVIGFDLKPDEKKALQALAAAGGGKYYDAKNYVGLLKSLDEFTTNVKASKLKREIYLNPVVGGKTQKEGQVISAGKYTLWKNLEKKEHAWFWVDTKPGQRVAVKVTIQGKAVVKAKDGKLKEAAHTDGGSSVRVYNIGGKRMSQMLLGGDAGDWMRMHMLDETGEGVWFTIGSDYSATGQNVLFEVIVQEAGDLNEGWEAPDDLKSPKVFEVPLGEKFIGHIGTPDRKDVYKARVKPGQPLKVDVIFSASDGPARFRVELFDAKTKRRLSRAVKLSEKAQLTLETKESSEVLVVVSDDNPKLNYMMNSYSLKLSQ